MCGIVGIFNVGKQSDAMRRKALEMSRKLRHRGPDWSGIWCGGSAVMAHERLSIVDPESGGQPLVSPDGRQVITVNGEIYNHQEIRRRYAGKYDFRTGSDCEVILALYRDKGPDFLEELNGIFAFALYDVEKDAFLIARDPIGVIPLYIGFDDADGKIYVASELKALEGQCERYEPFLPGHRYWSRELGMKRWYTREWTDYDKVKDNPADPAQLRAALESAVKRQLMSDVPYGVLLSGGLDSSVISAIAEKFSAMRIEDDSRTRAWWPRLHSFAVGLKGAPDLDKARLVGLRRFVLVGLSGRGPADRVEVLGGKELGVVAVAAGAKMRQLFHELGTDEVIEGGQTMNPPVQAFLEAFDRIGARHILVFPNNGNIVLTARQAAGLYRKSEVTVIPTHSLGEGYFALANLDTSLPADEIVSALDEVLSETVTGQVSRAIRESGAGAAGDYLGISGKEILCGAPVRQDALMEMARKLDAGQHDIAVLFQGADVPAVEAAAAVEAFSAAFPRTETTLIEGGQPIYDYILLLC